MVIWKYWIYCSCLCIFGDFFPFLLSVETLYSSPSQLNIQLCIFSCFFYLLLTFNFLIFLWFILVYAKIYQICEYLTWILCTTHPLPTTHTIFWHHLMNNRLLHKNQQESIKEFKKAARYEINMESFCAIPKIVRKVNEKQFPFWAKNRKCGLKIANKKWGGPTWRKL